MPDTALAIAFAEAGYQDPWDELFAVAIGATSGTMPVSSPPRQKRANTTATPKLGPPGAKTTPAA